jgi:hypothetical protein
MGANDQVIPMADVRDWPLQSEGAALFLNVQFQTHFKTFPVGVELLWLQTALLEHAVSYIACL